MATPRILHSNNRSQAIVLDECWTVPGCPVLLACSGLPGPELLQLHPGPGPGASLGPSCLSLISEAVSFGLSRPRFHFFPRDSVTGQEPEYWAHSEKPLSLFRPRHSHTPGRAPSGVLFWAGVDTQQVKGILIRSLGREPSQVPPLTSVTLLRWASCDPSSPNVFLLCLQVPRPGEIYALNRL